MNARDKATALVAKLTLAEKIGLLSRQQKPIPRLHLGAFNIGGEAAHGIVDREHYHLTSLPIPLTLAQTWDPELAQKAGHVVGTEARALYNITGRTGRLMPWAPTIDMERDPRWGRNEEAYGEDPRLAGSVAGGYIDGMQGTGDYLLVAAAPKHFMANNTEANRGSESNSLTPHMKHEYYLRPFKFAFRDHHAQSMMTGYNGVNGVPMMQSPELLATVKGAWGMDGCIVTDGGALTLNVEDYHYYDRFEDALADALKKGIDCFVDEPDKVEAAAFAALAEGQISVQDITRAVTNTLKVRARLGQLEDVEPFAEYDQATIGTAASDAVVQAVTAGGAVLLENHDKTLPLTTQDRVLLTGPAADRFVRDWYATLPQNTETLAQGMQKALGSRLDVVNSNDFATLALDLAVPAQPGLGGLTYEIERLQQGQVFLRDRASHRYLRFTEDGQLELNGTEVYDWVIREAFVLDGDGQLFAVAHDFAASDRNSLQAGGRGRRIGQITVVDPGLTRVLAALPGHTKAVVAAGNHPLLIARETEDRPDIALPQAQETLIDAVHDAGVKTAAVLIAGYPFDVSKLRCDALLTVGYAGQSLGTALANVLTGVTPPTGKLAQTWYNAAWQGGSMREYDIEKRRLTYQYADPAQVSYPFGYGLTYGKLRLLEAAVHRAGTALTISVDVVNHEDFAVTDTVQAYLNASNLAGRADRRQLVAFQKLTLEPGATAQLTLAADLRDFAWYDAKRRRPLFPVGDYTLSVGFDAFDHAAVLGLPHLGQAVAPYDLAQPLAAKAFDASTGATLTTKADHYEAVALEAGGSVTYDHLRFDGAVTVWAYAEQGGKLKAASGNETAETVFEGAGWLQPISLALTGGLDQTLRLSTDVPVTLVRMNTGVTA
ncbi:glycoside hydrolase family 3 N-terminal domain-containing protein [Lacticaseibacillus parakribbianus]|uniref:glycoside hydrolase family 3 N-terminal domain-containing protein n=1 Tax=Lacticaseibacillus parakribbianus TaxID=2970927 RepID=UPI0021CB6241|nr:glycoside hydrolase family 3 N-terminal domain-containing protein [Lacticaseibacillus parakribbianus]